MYRKVFAAASFVVLCMIWQIPAQAQSWTQVPGTLVQISVGGTHTNGPHVWGVNSAQLVYEYNDNGGWIQTPGSLVQIAVASDDRVIGVNASQQVYYFSRGQRAWIILPGFSATKIYAGARDVVWGINPTGGVERYDPGTGGLDTFTINLTQLSVSSDGSVWGLDPSGDVFYLDQQSQQFVQVSGATLSQIAVGFGGAVFGINSAGKVYEWDNATQVFFQIPGALTQIAVGSNNAVYGINSSQQIYQYNVTGGFWTQLPGFLTQISVATDGTVWGLNSVGNIYYFTP